ncbi:Peroxiredoxin [uncultured Desulfobacterium sp.]|uniref:Peroxiredoxin n=1 Tax=uncultured Desulfobacterium sp. TaxID=201089 RepID=A0A445MUB1_9BACT|nr:Peroxiredoxin [uncultured Desulfobacterium sp.]
MRPISRLLSSVLTVATMILCVCCCPCFGQLAAGKAVPGFSLKDSDGKAHDLATIKDQPMIILYFFDAESRPSQEGLLSLDKITKQYKEADMIVWGVTLSGKDKVAEFIKSANPGYPILLDDTGISDLYEARFILPTVCIIGPDLKLIDYFQGGGKTTEVMLVRLAERELQRRHTVLAKAISEDVEKKNPKNIQAKTVRGYAALKEGKIEQAEETFTALAKDKGEGEILGKEGMASVYARKGQADKAMEAVKEVEEKAPDRAYVHVVKADILYSQNKKSEAKAAYQTAVRKKSGEPFQKAMAYNQLGRFHAGEGDYQKARELYDQAVDIDPYYIEATSNKGVAYEKEGKWDEALKAYTKATNIDKADTFAAVLAKKAEEMIAIQKNVAEKQRIDTLVKELATRYRSQEKTASKTADTWTSRPMVLTFVDFQEQGGLSARDGFSSVLTSNLADQLNASGRVQVVERVLLERLLEELNIGSSELADPETALKLGKILSAKIIGTGSLFFMQDQTLLNMRLIDTETSAIPKVITTPFGLQDQLTKQLRELNRDILNTVIQKYPLQGYVIKMVGGQALLNIGSKQGVVLGTGFDVVEDAEPIEYKGKILQGAPKSIGHVEVVQVEPDLCYAKVVKNDREFKTDDKVKEMLSVPAAGGGDAIK